MTTITEQTPQTGFAAFDLPRALASTLAHMKYTNPTPVQAQAIPAAMKGKDVLGSAQTGTGKTGAFLIPIIARLMTDPHANALIMTPTRELAAQILVVARQMIHTNTTIRTALLIGGEGMGRQIAQIAGKPRLVVGTPGRINDHLRDRPTMFAQTRILVLDEADRMLDMGFAPQIKTIIETLPRDRQTLMFSATFADSILKFTKTYLNDPVRVAIEPERTSAANIRHETLETTENQRYDHLLAELDKRNGSVILFIKTKHGADRMAKRLRKDNHNADAIHGGLNQRQRDRAIAAFRAYKTRILVATDVAARGLDVPHIEHVINYDLPQVAEDYVHRIGRTARAGAEGSALSMIMPSERGKWNAIQRLLNPGQKQDRPRGQHPHGERRNNNQHKRGGHNIFRPRPAAEERNFNVEGAGGEDRFRSDRPDRDGQKPFQKPFKKKFFGKGHKPRQPLDRRA